MKAALSHRGTLREMALLLLAAFTLGSNASCQHTLITGETYTHTFTSLPSSPGGQWHSGILGVYLASNSVQPDDVIRLEMFEGNAGDRPVYDGTFTNLATFGGQGGPFAWWDLEGSCRLTMLSGSVIINRLEILVTTGPFSCPCTAHYTNIFPEPQVRMRVTPQLDGHIRLAWETNFAAFTLESAIALSDRTWTPVTNTVVTDGSYFAVLVSAEATDRYFRMRKN